MARKLRAYQTRLMKAKDSRVNLTNEVLSGIRLIKLYAWEGDFLKRINSLRSKELQELMT
jgi:ATP-binding cassette subfamily C (CFTR/MRP) protein 1